MNPDKPVTGPVVSYHYLWAREYDRGEESGRKARPACVMIPVGIKTDEIVLFPITTQPPLPGRLAVEIPEMERRRLNLSADRQSWIILDEGNRDIMPRSYHIEPIGLDPVIYAYGVFSTAFMRLVLRHLAAAIRSHTFRFVDRET